MAQQERKRSEQTGTRTRERVAPPKMYQVIFHNDDVTTMEFVVAVLELVFNKQRDEAYRLMLKVHREGKAVVGVYSLDIAMTKTEKAIKMARAEGYPLRITYEPE